MAETFASALVAVMAVDHALPDSPAAWLIGIARNELVDAVRRGQVDEKLAANSRSPRSCWTIVISSASTISRSQRVRRSPEQARGDPQASR